MLGKPLVEVLRLASNAALSCSASIGFVTLTTPVEEIPEKTVEPIEVPPLHLFHIMLLKFEQFEKAAEPIADKLLGKDAEVNDEQSEKQEAQIRRNLTQFNKLIEVIAVQ